MSDRRALAILFLIMAVVAVGTGGIALGTLYYFEIEQRRRDLAEAVHLQSQILLAEMEPGQPGAEPLFSDHLARIHRLLGRRGMLVITRSDGATSGSWDSPQLAGAEWSPADPSVALEEPVRRALAGESGSMIGASNSGRLLSAYAAVPEAEMAVVASDDLITIRALFLRSGSVMAVIAVGLFLGGTLIFFAVGNPIVRRIRDGENRFRELFENLRSGAAVYRAIGNGDDFVLTDFNRGAERIEQLSRQEVLGRPLSEIFPAIRAGRLFEVLRRVWRLGQPEHVPPILYQDAHLSGWRETYVYKLPTGEVVTLFEDVTDRKRSEEALRESEARWRSIIETHAQAIVIVDQKHEIRFVNKAAEALFGHDAQSLIGAPFGFPLVQGDVAEIEILRPGRSIAYGEMRAIPMRWSGQDNFLLFIQDVSAHKRAEGDLRKLFQAIEQSPASVMITDVNGRIEYVNPKFCETTGYAFPEVVGKTPGFLRSGHTSSREYHELWKTISDGRVWRGEFNNRRKNGELFWELASIAPVRDGRGKITHYVAVKEDISERKATEERLRHAQRMEMIGQLTGGIAHDFNNLLAIILGNLQLLEENRTLDAESRELITDAVWSAERGAQLTHRLLAFARRQRLNPRITDVNHVVEEMAGLLRRTLGERIQIREQLAPGVWETMIDRGQLESALLNLVVNARDAMPSGGLLSISTSNVVLPGGPESQSEGMASGEYVMLAVTDNGTGMAPEVAERIFEPFFTTKKFGEGSGLGLSMVYGFVHQSGGHIVVDTSVGKGTTLKLYLPRATASEEVLDQHTVQRLDRKPSGSEVILVVEDDSRVRKTASNILRKHGYEVVEASSAAEALHELARLPRLDLLFTDIVLANGMDGTELAQHVVRERPDTRILLTSGYVQQASPAGGDAGMELLPKPYRRSELTARVRSLLDRAPV